MPAEGARRREAAGRRASSWMHGGLVLVRGICRADGVGSETQYLESFADGFEVLKKPVVAGIPSLTVTVR